MSSLRASPSIVLLVLTLGSSAALAQPAKCPVPAPNPPPVTISHQFPQDVCLPTGDVPGITFFDDFSWRSFVAVVWPTLAGQRGVPDPLKVPGGSGTPVFQTYKADWETFQPDGSEPTEWSSYAVKTNPCGNLAPGEFVLAAFSKFGNVRLAGTGSLVGPLISQNVQYTRFLAAFNQVSFDNILKGKWYLQSGLTQKLTFKPDSLQNNPIDIKTSWVIMTPGMNASRFYTTTAHVYDTATNMCIPRTVGLVGMHIVTKTPTRPQWIWTTFEQIDAIPQPGAQKPYTYNDGGGGKMPGENPIETPTDVPCVPPPGGAPCPFNVTRITPMDSRTIATSGNYQRALASQGSGVWQYYQLVMTQWPTPGNSNKNGLPANTIPGTATSPMTAFANVTMETFDQARINTGCMSCHNSAASVAAQTDFVWAVPLNADPSQLGTADVPELHAAMLKLAPQSEAVKKLIAILEQGRKDMLASPKTAKPAKAKTKPKK
jgi:hypothetical protein